MSTELFMARDFVREEKQLTLQTERLKVAYYRTGEGKPRRLLMLHGNLSSSVFFRPLFPALERDFDVVAPDLRCFGDTEDLPVDATRGYRDWSDDIDAFLTALGWDSCIVLGWSMGGNVAMQFAMEHTAKVEKLVLIAPGSPFGFGGTYGEKGLPYYPLGRGSGGACVNPMLVEPLTGMSKMVMRDILNLLYFKPPFRMSLLWENLLIEGISKTKLGHDRYPGDGAFTFQWPFVCAGKHGVLNAMSPKYGNQSAIVDMENKPPILWVHGEDDIIVSDRSMMEMGGLGSFGMVPGWPGYFFYPPQPMVSQTRYVFGQYRDKGGMVEEVLLPGGHMCCLESPEMFLDALFSFIYEKEKAVG